MLIHSQLADANTTKVFVITICARKARVLQAHFDTRLVIQKTNIIDLEKENYDGIKYLLRWMLCEPTGNTLRDTPAKGFESPVRVG